MWDYKTPSDEWIYLYTADDERAWSYKTDDTSLWTLRGLDAKVLREYNSHGTWSVASDSIYRSGLLLATETPQGTRHLHLGTPRLISDPFGNQAAYHVYYPFGEEATTFNQDTLRAKFTGHERNLGNAGGAGDDLDYMHARHESPVTGRFLGMDPNLNAKRALKIPQGWNLYTYVENNPLRYADLDGRELGLDVNMLATPNETPAQSLAMGAAAGGLAVGLVMAPEALAAATPISNAMFALGVKYQGVINFFRNLGAGLTDTPASASSIAAVEGRAGLLQRVVRADGSLNLSRTVENQLLGLTKGKDRSFIPAQSILDAISSGSRAPIPKKVVNQFLYAAEAIYNGSKGVLEVVVNERTGQIVHVLFKSAK